jgi:hypothetical protein
MRSRFVPTMALGTDHCGNALRIGEEFIRERNAERFPGLGPAQDARPDPIEILPIAKGKFQPTERGR